MHRLKAVKHCGRQFNSSVPYTNLADLTACVVLHLLDLCKCWVTGCRLEDTDIQGNSRVAAVYRTEDIMQDADFPRRSISLDSQFLSSLYGRDSLNAGLICKALR